MVKTTVYLAERDVAALRRLSAETGRSQAEIIREAVAAATASAGERTFRSHGAGRGGGEAVGRAADDLVRTELGSRSRH